MSRGARGEKESSPSVLISLSVSPFAYFYNYHQTDTRISRQHMPTYSFLLSIYLFTVLHLFIQMPQRNIFSPPSPVPYHNSPSPVLRIFCLVFYYFSLLLLTHSSLRAFMKVRWRGEGYDKEYYDAQEQEKEEEE